MNNIAADLLNLPVYYNQYYICWIVAAEKTQVYYSV